MSRGFFSRLLDLLFPPRCTFCRRFLKNNEKCICEECGKTLPYVEKVGRKGEFFSVCVSPLYYKNRVRSAVLRFKFKSATNYTTCFGKILAECISDNLKGKYDYITWVPLSEKRRKKRGYDQAALLAMATALELDDVAIEILRKPVDVPAQSGVGAAEKRRANVSGVYEVIEPEIIMGNRILVIDDIITTGATLSECARVLLTAGAKEVLCAALATTERD